MEIQRVRRLIASASSILENMEKEFFNSFIVRLDIKRSKQLVESLIFLPARAAGSAASAAIEKLKEPGVENNLLSAGPIKNGGAVCECILLSISSSLFELQNQIDCN